MENLTLETLENELLVERFNDEPSIYDTDYLLGFYSIDELKLIYLLMKGDIYSSNHSEEATQIFLDTIELRYFRA